jgi:hypothetical protein
MYAFKMFKVQTMVVVYVTPVIVHTCTLGVNKYVTSPICHSVTSQSSGSSS